MLGEYKYYAFISYKREDEKWAAWLQKKIENYKLPTSLRKSNPDFPKQVKRCFRDTTDLTAGVLEKAIQQGLQASKYLIVICSPRAAQSTRVCKEVEEFITSGREEYIIPFIVEGQPHSKDEAKECFPRNLRELSGKRELLGININETGRDIAATKAVAHMFGLQFDTLWQRETREKKRRRRWIITLSLLVALLSISVAAAFIFQNRQMRINQARAVAHRASQLVDEGDSYLAQRILFRYCPTRTLYYRTPMFPKPKRLCARLLAITPLYLKDIQPELIPPYSAPMRNIYFRHHGIKP